MSAREALAHIYFKDIREKDQLQEAFCDASRSHYNSIWDSSRFLRPNFFSLCRDCFDDVIS